MRILRRVRLLHLLRSTAPRVAFSASPPRGDDAFVVGPHTVRVRRWFAADVRRPRCARPPRVRVHVRRHIVIIIITNIIPLLLLLLLLVAPLLITLLLLLLVDSGRGLECGRITVGPLIVGLVVVGSLRHADVLVRAVDAVLHSIAAARLVRVRVRVRG